MKALAGLLRRLADRIAPPVAFAVPIIGQPRATTGVDRAWDKALSDYLLSIGDKARATATAWGASATGLLAVIGAASILKGRDTLDGLVDPARYLLLGFVLVALIASFSTLYWAAEAAQGSPTRRLLAPNTYREAQFRAAESAGRLMTWSRRGAILSFGAAVLATVVVLIGPEVAAKPSLTLVVGGVNGQQIACGKLEVKGGKLLVGDAPAPEPALTFHVVKEC